MLDLANYPIINAVSSTIIMPAIAIIHTKIMPISILSLLSIVIITLIIAFMPLLLFKYALDEQLKTPITSIENVNHLFLPIYLGYFFVTFSIPSFELFIITYFIILVFLSFSKMMYFNPFLLLIGYSFYKIHTSNGINVYVLSKQHIVVDNITITHLKRLNDITFLEVLE